MKVISRVLSLVLCLIIWIVWPSAHASAVFLNGPDWIVKAYVSTNCMDNFWLFPGKFKAGKCKGQPITSVNFTLFVINDWSETNELNFTAAPWNTEDRGCLIITVSGNEPANQGDQFNVKLDFSQSTPNTSNCAIPTLTVFFTCTMRAEYDTPAYNCI